MRGRVSTLAILALAAVALPAADAAAQPYDVSWWTVDGGGGTSSGGPYVLTGTAGQPDAGGPFAGSPYGLHSGFWALAAGFVGPEADLSVTKADGQASAVPGQSVTYTIVASNLGPSAVTAATVSDTPPASLTNVTWTCVASGGSSCPASGSGAISASVNLLVNGSATFSLTATIVPGATGTLSNSASISAPAGVLDPAGLNNAATDVDTLTPLADLAVSISDSPDPVGQGASLVYTIDASNVGPSTSPSLTLTDTLPAQVTFVSSTPGAPTCMHVAGVVTCTLASTLGPGGSTTVTIQATVNPTATGTLSNTATVSGGATDPVAANNADAETTLVVARSDGELRHGTRERFDLAALPGPIADEDRFRIRQQPFSSYEVIVDETSGDIGTGNGPTLERLDVTGTSVLQGSQPAGSGPSRSLRWENSTSEVVDDETIRVRSASCTTDCGTDDAYRIRAYETTYSVPRFNNAGSQITVLLLQNTGVSTVNGHVYFWSPAGSLLATRDVSLTPKQVLVLNTTTVPGLVGQNGTMTISHDGPHGTLAGKTVALEPATGFSFDSPMEVKR
jgi:uncharacterized repeat protein (TIGR01451 family)